MIEIIKNISRKIGLITLTIALFSVLSYLITYCFLYGYYFGGEMENTFSNFEFFRRFVPFHTNTMSFTYLMISLSVTLIIYTWKILKEKGAIYKFITLILLVIFHLMMTVFFSQEINLKNIGIFSAIWIFPLFITIIISVFVQATRVPFKTFSGMLFGISIMIIILIFYQGDIPEEWAFILVNILGFGFGIILSMIPYKKCCNFIFIFPYPFLIAITIIAIFLSDYFKVQSEYTKISIIIGIPFLISIVLSKYFRGTFKEKENTDISNGNTSNNRVILEVISVILNPKTHKGVLAFLVMILLGVYVMTPRVSTATAKIIRSFTPPSKVQFDLISVKDIDDKQRTIKGIIVAEQDNVIYISNENWELVQVKTNSYFVERGKE